MFQRYNASQLKGCFRTGLIALCLFSFSPRVQAQNTNQQLTPREIARTTLPSVVLVIMTNGSTDEIIYGSGFFVKPDVVATNFHVIEKANKGYVRIVGGETKYEVIGVVALDRSNDLALLKLRGITGKPLPVAQDAAVAVGDSVFAVGNPKGLEGTFSQGIISSIRRDKQASVLQITAAISSGSSGGPVLDVAGRVIGVAVGAIEGGESLNFAIPASYLAELLTKEAKLIPLYTASRSDVGDQISRRLRPRIVNTRPSPGELATPRRSFKKSDLTDGLSGWKSLGPVSTIEISSHKFSEKFGRWEMTSPWEIERVVFDEFGNIETDEGFMYKDFMGIMEFVTPPSAWEPRRYKSLYRYDSSQQQVLIDRYGAAINEKVLEYSGKDIRKYRDGDLVESSSYDPDGSLRSKEVNSTRSDGSRLSVWFESDGSKSSSHRTYLDSSGVEVEENYNKQGELTTTYRKTKVMTAEGILETLSFYPEDTISRWVTLCDSQSGLEREATSYLADRVKERRKFEYHFDGRGNWIRKVQYTEVSKFGKTYFEPQEIILRKITYRQSQSTERVVPRRRKR